MTDETPKLTKEQHEALQKAVEELFADMDKHDDEPHMYAGGLIPTECDCCRERKRRRFL
jgi:hypothetical protein